MSPDEKIPTIQRDVAYVAAQIDIAKDAARQGNSQKAWYHMDMAEARLQGLSMFIGPWNDRPPTRGTIDFESMNA